MALDKTDVEKIAHLARLQVEEQDVAETVKNLSDIMGFVAQLSAVDTTDVTPMAHPLDAMQRLRLDIVTEGDQRDKFQALAPQSEAGLYLVPQVID